MNKLYIIVFFTLFVFYMYQPKNSENKCEENSAHIYEESLLEIDKVRDEIINQKEENEILQRDVKYKNNLLIFSILVFIGFLIFFIIYRTRIINSNKDVYNNLTENSKNLQSLFEELRKAYKSLKKEHERLGETYESLNDEYEKLREAYESLKQEHEVLGETYERHKIDYKELYNEYNNSVIHESRNLEKMMNSQR